MDTRDRFRFIRAAVWGLSTFALIVGLVFIRESQVSPLSGIGAALLIEAGGAFFFALTVGWTLDRLRDAEGYSVLWAFGQEFREAGILEFYSGRKNRAERALEQAFARHHEGEVRIAGASLRVFFSPGLHFYPWIQQMLRIRAKRQIVVKALSCNPEGNHELPVRSFIEEFNQDQTIPKCSPFEWKCSIDFLFDDFEEDFFKDHGIEAPPQQRVRVIQDLESTRTGVRALQGVARNSGNHLDHREFNCAPYCTVIIFPDRAFYTPNLLCTEVPVNLPMLVFHKSSDAYKRLVNYVEFLWWISDRQC